jgi:hypothetical protein
VEIHDHADSSDSGKAKAGQGKKENRDDGLITHSLDPCWEET